MTMVTPTQYRYEVRNPVYPASFPHGNTIRRRQLFPVYTVQDISRSENSAIYRYTSIDAHRQEVYSNPPFYRENWFLFQTGWLRNEDLSQPIMRTFIVILLASQFLVYTGNSLAPVIVILLYSCAITFSTFSHPPLRSAKAARITIPRDV